MSREAVRLEQLPRDDRYSSFFISPDGTELAVDVMNENGMHDIWIHDFNRKTINRQTTDPANDFLGVWSPDGKRLVFGSSRTAVSQLYLATKGGGGAEQQITDGPIRKYPVQWTRDGKYVLYRGTDPTGRDDLWALAVDGDRKPFPVVQTAYSTFTGQVSPDGKWIAYQSTDSGTDEVYVRSFPVPGVRVPVSNRGGRWPKWRADGKERELYFVSANDMMVAVKLELSADGLKTQEPKELFRAILPNNLTYPYDVSADGKRFLILERIGRQNLQLEVMTNWRARMK